MLHKYWVALIFFTCLGHAAEPASVVVRAELSPLLIAAQEAIKAKNPQAALDKLSAAQAIGSLTAQEKVILHRVRVVAALDAAKPALSIESLDALIAAPEVAAAEKPGLIEVLISQAQKQKDHQRVVEASKQYAVLAPLKRGVVLAQAQAHYFLKQFEPAIEGFNRLLPKAGKTADSNALVQTPPEEALLRMLADSHNQRKNRSGYLDGLTLLLTYYPSQAYWSDYLARQMALLEPNSPFALDWYRLMRATQTLEDFDDYKEYAQVALKQGLPQEALAVFEQGVKSGVVGQGNHKAASDALQQQIASRVAQDAGSMALLEKQVAEKNQSNDSAQLGDLYMSGGAWQQANAAYQKALNLGSLRREVLTRLHLGIALAQLKQKETAKAALAWAGFDPAGQALANSWQLWALKPLP